MITTRTARMTKDPVKTPTRVCTLTPPAWWLVCRWDSTTEEDVGPVTSVLAFRGRELMVVVVVEVVVVVVGRHSGATGSPSNLKDDIITIPYLLSSPTCYS